MLLSLQSTGPDYNRLQTNINIPWNCEYIKYHVASINTRNVLLTSVEDEVEFEWNDDRRLYQSEDKYDLGRDDIYEALHWDQDNNDQVFGLGFTDSWKTLLTPLVDGFKFTKLSHRLALITGLYNIEVGKVYPRDQTIVGEVPIFDYANKLYLVSKQGQGIQSNIGDREYTPSVIASIDHVIRRGVPIMMNFETYGKPIKNVVNIDSFKQIELELVDFQFQPVKLMSPMFITIKVKPCLNPKMKLT